MGDVILIDLADGVFTGREPHNSHRNPMKLFNAIAAAAVIGTSFISINPAEASIRVNLSENTITYKNDGLNKIVVDNWIVKRSESARYPLGDSAAINASETTILTRSQHNHYSAMCNSC